MFSIVITDRYHFLSSSFPLARIQLRFLSVYNVNCVEYSIMYNHQCGRNNVAVCILCALTVETIEDEQRIQKILLREGFVGKSVIKDSRRVDCVELLYYLDNCAILVVSAKTFHELFTSFVILELN